MLSLVVDFLGLLMINASRHDAVLHLTLARPDKKNAINSQMYRELTEALLDAEKARSSPGLFLFRPLHRFFGEDPRTDRPALLAMIDVRALAAGRHVLSVDRPPLQPGAKPAAAYDIPFWR